MKTSVWLLGSVALALVGGACSSGSPTSGFSNGPNGGSGGSSGGSSGASSSGGSSSGPLGGSGSGSGGSGGGTCVVTDPNADSDKDGWSTAQGDCNDCDPQVNPGAIDVLQTNDGGTPTWGDEDCDGKPGDSAMPCDTGLALTDVDPNDGAKAIELCVQATQTDRRYGVLSAAYVRADGTAFPAPGAQVGIQSAFGTNVHVQGGANMLALSSGYARTVGQAGACNGINCQTNATGTPPPGFPEDDPTCPKTTKIADDIALELQIRVPTNATGYSFSFKFYSFEFPDWVCDSNGYNDQFIALVNPAPAGAWPAGAAAGNISFDSNNHPVSVNLGFFDTCDPGSPTRFAANCKKATGATCPATPNPYCPSGLADLAGTGFDVWDTKSTEGPAGATRWLQTQAPATPGSVITIRFAMWDAGNYEYDSTVLVDDFQWIASPGVTVGTVPVKIPK